MRNTKFICLLLSLVMVLGCFTSAFATSFVDSESNTTAINTIQSLGIVNGYPDGTFGANKNITRAEFAKVITTALGYDFNLTSATEYSDVPSVHWASGYIAMATSLNIINGYGNGMFGPEDNITYAQAITMLVRALGYTDSYLKMTSPQTTYPLVQTLTAIKLGVLTNVNYTNLDAVITRGEVAQLLYNALNVDIVNYNIYGLNMSEAGDTFLKRCSAKATKGVITYTSKTKIDLLNEVGKYGYTYTDAKGYVIATVATSEQLTGHMSAGKFVSNDVKYTISGTTATAIYNAKAVGTVSVSAIAAEYGTGEITLNCDIEDGKIVEVYSVCQWTAQKEVQLTKSTVFNEKKFTLAGLKFANDGIVVEQYSYMLNGANEISDLVSGDMVTIYCYGGNSNIVRVDVCDDIVSGVVTKITSNPVTYTINGTSYKSDVTLTLGVEYKCYLNASGVIVKAVVINGTEYSDYVVFVGEYTEAYGDHVAVFYTVAAPTKYVKHSATSALGLTPGALFTFTTNVAGKINTIDTAATAASIKYTGHVVVIDGKYYLPADNIAVWAFDGTNYSIVDLASVEVATELIYGTEGQFALDENGMIIAMVIDAAQSAAVSAVKYAVINSYGIALNTNNEPVNYINGYMDGEEVNFERTMNASIVVPTGAGLYKVEYSGDAIKQFTEVTPTAITCAAINGHIVTDTDTQMYVLSNNVVVYSYNALTGYTLDVIEEDDELWVYDTSKIADGLYDVVIIK